MTARVTPQEAVIVNRYFRAARAARELTTLECARRLTRVERRQLDAAEYEREGLRPLIKTINSRSLATQ